MYFVLRDVSAHLRVLLCSFFLDGQTQRCDDVVQGHDGMHSGCL
jgi:hypothetical protein